MLMAGYRDLLRTPGVARIIAAQLTARVPQGMLSLSLLIHIESTYGTYGAAGLVLGSMSVGQAVAGPLTSRWMGAWGMRRVLVLTSLVFIAAIVVVALVPMPIWGAMAVSCVAGLASPPVTAAVRTIYPKMVNASMLGPLYSLDAAIQELLWVGGPVIATFVATQISPVVALLVAMGFALGGGAWFILSPELGRVRIPPPKGGIGAVLRKPVVLIMTLVGFLVVGNCAAIEAGVVSIYGDSGPQAGIVIAVWSIGSLVGGLILGSRAMTPWSLAIRLGIMTVGSVLAALSTELWWLMPMLLLAGVGIAPSLAVMSASVSSSVRFSETAEAYGWTGTGQLIGAALGSAVAGFLIDGIGSIGGFVTAAALVAIAVVIAATTTRWIPDLRRGEIGPQPDTAPVRTV